MIKRILDAFAHPLGRIGLVIAILVVLSTAVWGIAQTQPASANLSISHTGSTSDWGSSVCTAILEHGSTPVGPNPTFSMLAWGDNNLLTPQQIADVIACVIQLNP